MWLKICYVSLRMEQPHHVHQPPNYYFTIGRLLMRIYSIAEDCFLSLQVNILFFYLRKCTFYTNKSFISDDLIPFVCQREICPNAGNAEATKVCYDHNVSISYSTDSPPPLYLCIECANEIHREHANLTFGDILHPMAQVSMICENKVSAIKNVLNLDSETVAF